MFLSKESSKRLFDLTVHAAWADRAVAAEEVGVARAAARVLHPQGEEGARGDLALGPDRSLMQVARGLSEHESALGFALALWVVLADGVETPRETALLDRWRLIAGLPSDITGQMRRVVRRTRVTVQAPPWDDQLRFLLREASGVLRSKSP